MKDFRYSFLVTAICVGLAGWWGTSNGMGIGPAIFLILVLGVLEVSLSFDNAVVNASVLKEMDEFWRQLFLTVGILVAVFGMRLVFPLLIVAVATDQGLIAVAKMAVQNPSEYERHLTSSHASIAAFGGMFLLLVFLSFLLDEGKELHWLGKFEEKMASLGKLSTYPVLISGIALLLAQHFLPLDDATRLSVVVSGIGGIILYLAVDSLDALFQNEEEGEMATSVAKRSGVAAFMYLEVLDASFSFDGVIGAFAITSDVVIIMLGLAIGAMFVRSMTINLVHRGTLDEYIFLEHGAHYAIGALAVIMLMSISFHTPEIVTGTIGIVFIALSLYSSVRHKKKLQT